MASTSYLRKQFKRASERGRRMGIASGIARRRALANKQDSIQETRVIEITIRDSHRPMTIIRAKQIEKDDGRWSRLRVDGSTGRPIGRCGLGMKVASAVL